MSSTDGDRGDGSGDVPVAAPVAAPVPVVRVHAEGGGVGSEESDNALLRSYAASSPVAHALRRNSLLHLSQAAADEHAAASPGADDDDAEDSDDEEERGSLLRHQKKAKKKSTGAAGTAAGARPGSSASAAAANAAHAAARSRAKAGREYCDIPSIFNSTEEDMEYARGGEEPLMGEWQVRAAAAVVRHRQSTQNVYSASPWSFCSLSFRDSAAEQAFHYYFSQLNEHKLRRRLLLLNFLYMIYATIEWGTRTSKHYSIAAQTWITVLRVFYIVINAIIFSISFIRRNFYRRNINAASTILTLLTSTLIIWEGHILRNIYSPFVLIVLLMYMVGSNIYVRTLFTVSAGVCWYNLILYNFVCLVFNPTGDLSTLHSPRAALVQLVYYDLILVFFILTIMYQTRRVEKQARYGFLVYYNEAEEEEKQREREQASASAAAAAEDGCAAAAGGRSAQEVAAQAAGIDQARGGNGVGTQEHKEGSSSGTDIYGHDFALPDPAIPVASGSGAAAVAAAAARPHLLPRTKAEELALLRELNAHERAEDPFFFSKIARLFLPRKPKNAPSSRGSATARTSSEGTGRDRDGPGGSSAREREVDVMTDADFAGLIGASPTLAGFAGPSQDGAGDTVFSNDPLYSTLSLMRAKGITSMADFIRHLAHQNKVKRAENHIRDLPCLCCASELPPWFTNYPYVQTMYRANYTAAMCVRSIFQIHNETVNIWTEFVPAILFTILFFVLEAAHPVVLSSKTSGADRFFVMVGLVGGLIVRPVCSGLAHTFFPMSNRAFVIWWSVDYVSILVSIMGYALVMGRFTFYCMLSQQIFFYISVLVLFLSTIAAVLFVASPGIRTSSFVLYVLFANGVPYVYQLVLSAADVEEYDVPARYLMFWSAMWGLMLLGLLVKTAMVPERWFPGRFDIFGASHQWWHLLVNSGAACAYFTWTSYLQWRPTAQCPPSYGWDG